MQDMRTKRSKKTAEKQFMVFVGGYNDGLRMFVSGDPKMRLPVPADRQLSWGKIESEEYELDFVPVGKTCISFPFYRAKDMPPHEAMERLLHHYQPPKMAKVA